MLIHFSFPFFLLFLLTFFSLFLFLLFSSLFFPFPPSLFCGGATSFWACIPFRNYLNLMLELMRYSGLFVCVISLAYNIDARLQNIHEVEIKYLT